MVKILFDYHFNQHEDYGSGAGAFPNDISLVEFDSPVTGLNIKPVPLAPSGSEHSGNPNCYITGWGRDGMDKPQVYFIYWHDLQTESA